MDKGRQIPIWFFIGLILTFYGIVILGTGIFHLFHPPAHPVALQGLHPDIWWAAVLLAVGLIYVIKHAPWRSRFSQEESERHK